MIITNILTEVIVILVFLGCYPNIPLRLHAFFVILAFLGQKTKDTKITTPYQDMAEKKAYTLENKARRN